jgi:hypothetical protein
MKRGACHDEVKGVFGARIICVLQRSRGVAMALSEIHHGETKREDAAMVMTPRETLAGLADAGHESAESILT